MSIKRLLIIPTVPEPIKRVFHLANEPSSGEERLWRERAARMILDALGYTNFTTKPNHHNAAVRYARRWFRQLFPDDDAEANFTSAGLPFKDVKKIVLDIKPLLFE